MNESWNRSCGSFIFVFASRSLARPAPYTTISLYGTHVLNAAFLFLSFPSEWLYNYTIYDEGDKRWKGEFAKRIRRLNQSSFINSMLEPSRENEIRFLYFPAFFLLRCFWAGAWITARDVLEKLFLPFPSRAPCNSRWRNLFFGDIIMMSSRRLRFFRLRGDAIRAQQGEINITQDEIKI